MQTCGLQVREKITLKWKRNVCTEVCNVSRCNRIKRERNERTTQRTNVKKSGCVEFGLQSSCHLVALLLHENSSTLEKKIQQKRFQRALHWISVCWKQKRNIQTDRANCGKKSWSVLFCNSVCVLAPALNHGIPTGNVDFVDGDEAWVGFVLHCHILSSRRKQSEDKVHYSHDMRDEREQVI